jgi:multiple sugar transport system permease protein
MTETTLATKSKPIRVTSRLQTQWRRIEWTAYLFILPAFVLILVFHIFPVFYAIDISLNTGAINRFRFVGLANYITALTSGDFWNAFAVSVWYVLLTLPVTLILGLGFAYLLYQRIHGRGIYRTLYFLPYVISTVASSIVWAWVFDPASGLANIILARLGMPPQRWLVEPTGVGELVAQQLHVNIPGWAQGPSLALVAVAIFTIWQTMGYDIILFLAGLTNIPGELYDAARIDGANARALFRYITFPLLAPTTFFVVVISVIGSFQAFNQIYAMNVAAAQTLGGPLGSTTTMTVYMFDQLYTYANYGYASAIAVLLSALILILTVFNFRILGARVSY